jgi:hypothetical protein
MAESTHDVYDAPITKTGISPAGEDATHPKAENKKQLSPGSKRLKLPDWQPLGSIRDSFFEQMKQDNRL